MPFQNDEEYYQVRSVHAVAGCLDVLMQPGGASLQLDRSGASVEPVILKAVEPGGWLQIDLTPSVQLQPLLESGVPFVLLGQGNGKMMRSPPLVAQKFVSLPGGRVECFCPYPEWFDILQRRDTFRAELRLGMDTVAELGDGDQRWAGYLKNLSMTGCLLELPLSATAMLATAEREAQQGAGLLTVRMTFPSGTHFAIEGQLRHQMANLDERYIRVGIEFVDTSPQQEKQLWYFVREIEREVARYTASDTSNLVPSPLFRSPGAGSSENHEAAVPAISTIGDYPTATARRLLPVAEFIDVQIMALGGGDEVDPTRLSRAAERVLTLHDEDREELLFALACHGGQPVLTGHCLSVAVRLGDLARMAKMPRDVLKAVVAAGLVHDMGKALLPRELLQSPVLDARQRRELRSHVSLLMPKLAPCRWLASGVVKQVVQQVNERVDGSGYPAALRGEELGELARLAAVVDAVDAMARPRMDRPAHTMDAIYATLEREAQRYDARWLQHYRGFFGQYPIGSLLRFGSGELGWVRRLDREGRLAQVQLTKDAVVPSMDSLGKKFEGHEIARLGPVAEVLLV